MAETAIAPSGWMTTADVAAAYPFSAAALVQMRRAKKGPRYAKTGRTVRYHRDDVEAWLREGLVR